MRSDMRRPSSPAISEWIEAMEQDLTRRVRQDSARIRRHGRLAPLLTGSAALAGAALVVTMGLSSPAPPASNSDVAAGEQPPAAAERAGFGALGDLMTYEDAAGFTASYDILGRNRGLTGTPRSDAPAVPTPDGGGSVPTALRPTVS